MGDLISYQNDGEGRVLIAYKVEGSVREYSNSRMNTYLLNALISA
jgi:hypothetical protein